MVKLVNIKGIKFIWKENVCVMFVCLFIYRIYVCNICIESLFMKNLCIEFVLVFVLFFYLVNKGIPGHLNLSHKGKKYFSRKLSH